MATLALAQELPPPTTTDTGKTTGGKVEFPAWTAQTEKPSGNPPNPMPVDKRVGFAIVGLGRLSLENILPAFAGSEEIPLGGTGQWFTGKGENGSSSVRHQAGSHL